MNLPFFYAQNLTQQAMLNDVLPWDFKFSDTITPEIRDNKELRQRWYRSPTTQHYFYTGIEAFNPNQRVSKKDNPPRNVCVFCGDYDLALPDEQIEQAIAKMTIKPTAVERSLGGKTRLVWLLPAPIRVDSYDFTVFILQKAVKWLKMDLLPGLDEPAFTDPSRLYCNGGSWKATNHAPVPADELQAFFVQCCSEFNFKSCESGQIPLEEIELGLREKYPNFTWPDAFVLESQGPSFWLPTSTSPKSAIVKRDGMVTFSGSAEKLFYSWSEILGPEFVRRFAVESIAKATLGSYWDGKHFWRKISGVYKCIDPAEMMDHFETTCGLSNKAEGGRTSSIKRARTHIHNFNRIEGAAPFVGRPSGRINYNGDYFLNTYNHTMIQPATIWTPWGLEGKFPFLSKYLYALLDPVEQLDWLLAWFKHFYVSMLVMRPEPGQNIFLMGEAGVGKTLFGRRIVGDALGGSADAGDFLTTRQPFNSQMFHRAVWGVDDEGMHESAHTQALFQAAIKKFTANQEFLFHKKYGEPLMIEWMGRIIVTANMDHVSSRVLGGMDNSSRDKTSLFRCSSKKEVVFPPKHILQPMIATELPYLLRYLVDWEVPAHVPRNNRYGYEPKHEESLLDMASQGGRSAPFKELLIEALSTFFSDHPDAKVWTGTTTALLRLLSLNPYNDFTMRSLKAEQVNRYLEMIQREGLIVCRVETGALKTRYWVFDRFGSDPTSPPAAPETPSPNPFTT